MDQLDDQFDRLRQGLERAMRGVCPPWLAAEREDLVQLALIRLMNLARKGGERTWSAAYLRRAAYCQVVDEIRRRRRRRETPIETEAGELPLPGGIDPERLSMGQELGRAVRGCLERLIPPRRRAITLRLMGYPNREIAERLGWTPKRAENLVTRGKADLKSCLEAEGFAP